MNIDPKPGKDVYGGGGGRIRIDSALFIRVGDVPGSSNKEARDDLEGVSSTCPFCGVGAAKKETTSADLGLIGG